MLDLKDYDLHDCRSWKARIRLFFLGVCFQVQGMKFGDSKGWALRGWIPLREGLSARRIYVTWVRKDLNVENL